jgi:hypothetical protein
VVSLRGSATRGRDAAKEKTVAVLAPVPFLLSTALVVLLTEMVVVARAEVVTTLFSGTVALVLETAIADAIAILAPAPILLCLVARVARVRQAVVVALGGVVWATICGFAVGLIAETTEEHIVAVLAP